MAANVLLIFAIAGLMAASALPILPPWLVVEVIALLCLLLLLLYIRNRDKGGVWHCLPALLCFGLGFAWSVFHGHQLFAQRLPESYASADFLVEGVVVNLPEHTERGERFDLQVERIVDASVALDTLVLKKLRLNSYSNDSGLQEWTFQPGQRWRLWLRLKPPRGMVNPYGFDYEAWLLQQDYSAVGYVRSSPANSLLPEASGDGVNLAQVQLAIKKSFDRRGFASLKWINAHIADLDRRALFAAIALGYKDEFTRQHWDVLKNTGTIHLVVVSGLNVVLAASLGYVLAAVICRLLFFPLYLLPAPVWGAMGAMLLAVFYTGMTGWSLPTQRSLLMVLCGLMTLLWRRQIPVSTGFLLALAIVLAWDPLAAFGASLWLSFGAVAILLYGFAARLYWQREKWDVVFFLQQWLYTQAFVSLGLFPLLAYWMGSVPLVMPLANLFAVPFATFVLLPLTILSGLAFMLSHTLGELVLALTGRCMDLFWLFLQWMQALNSNWYMTMGDIDRGDTPSIVVLLFSVIGILVLLLPKAVVPRYYGLALLLPLLIPLHHSLPKTEFELTLVDVGQGISAVIETQHHITVFDVGNRYSDQFDIGRDVVAQLLGRKGYRHIDTLVISHSDSDHAGGLTGVLDELPVQRLLSGNADIIQQRLADYPNASVETCRRGEHWVDDGVRFDILSPDEQGYGKRRNNLSCVIRVSNGSVSLLLTGDIERDRERWLLEQGDLSRTTVLVVPHHGSKSSSSAEFLAALDPALALVSVGYRSQYGHPHAEVVSRYHEHKIPLWRTDSDGALRWNSSRPHEIEASRRVGASYWHRW